MKNTEWLTDSKAVQDYLLAFDLFPAAPEEGIQYINHALKRWVITLEMIPAAPPGGGEVTRVGIVTIFYDIIDQQIF